LSSGVKAALIVTCQKAITHRCVIVCVDFLVIYLLTGKARTAVGFERVWARIRLPSALLASRALYFDCPWAGDLVFDDFKCHAVADAQCVEECEEHVASMKEQLAVVFGANKSVALAVKNAHNATRHARPSFDPLDAFRASVYGRL
jgi:hypothetical protein